MNKLELYKRKVRSLAKEGLKHGKIVQKFSCEICGSTARLYMHHNDYTKPYEVQWLCRNCHFSGVHNPKSPIYIKAIVPNESVYKNTERRNKSKFNHNYKVPDLVKSELKYRKIKFSEWCRSHNVKDSQVRDLFAKRVKGDKGIYADIWILLDKEFPGWNHHINYYEDK